MPGIFDDNYNDNHRDSTEQAFQDIDYAMIDVIKVLSSPSKTNAIRSLCHAHSGSCALLSIYEPEMCTLHVAFTGDSCAVRGRKKEAEEKMERKKDAYEVFALLQIRMSITLPKSLDWRPKAPANKLFRMTESWDGVWAVPLEMQRVGGI
ncbi:hypothetical protein GYMLUDRAFT_980045 [Collybiopsis luxurians FD-317 M1]|uniref:Uncharacterized protein n=1 Tax=Collybiopsis luxurians FD-317 M1 TaxID=944289 RepID=A0A0D0C1S0_9AGAR|nr:hypothetical protein GYMLUDRAFT_980045 [Collybiopsis luxurians FD-317 M1]